MTGNGWQVRGRDGFTLVEVVLALLILVLALLGLAGAAAKGLEAADRTRDEARYWADVQRVTDSLMARGFGNVSSGSTTLHGHAISWTAGSAASAPQQLTILIGRPTYRSRAIRVTDTVVVYLSKMTPGP